MKRTVYLGSVYIFTNDDLCWHTFCLFQEAFKPHNSICSFPYWECHALMEDLCQILNALAHGLFSCFNSPVLTLNTSKWQRITEKNGAHVSHTSMQICCSRVEVPPPSNYKQWRLIPAFDRKKVLSQWTHIIYHVWKYVPAERISSPPFKHKPSFCFLIPSTPS